MSIRTALMAISFFLSVAMGIALSREGAVDARKKERPLIGFSMDTLKEARWQRDREIFENCAKKLGAEVLVQSANSNDSRQIQDIQALISRKVDVLVIVPHDGLAMAKGVALAHEAGIPVIAYDRMIRNCQVDIYMSFDNVKVGELQARFIADHLPGGKGRIIRVHGSKTDNNAHLYKKGQDHILAPLIERGDIAVIHEDWADNWKPENGKKIVNAAITKFGDNFDAVLAANDGTASGAIQALIEEGLAGKKLVTGQDAELVACQRIAAGTQTMTVYKPLNNLAATAAQIAVRMAERKVVVAPATVANGAIDVPSILLEICAVTQENMMDTIIGDSFHSYEEVYGAIAEDKRPRRK